MTLKEQIVDAAYDVLTEHGLAGATTRQIATRAGCAEGSIYRHFPSKEALFVEVMFRRLPGLVDMVKQLHTRVGTGDVRHHLRELCRTAVAFYTELLPITAAALGDPALRDGLRDLDAGPHRANAGVAAYLAREQAAGRIAADIDPAAAAALILGACQQRAVLATFTTPEPDDADAFADTITTTLWTGIHPHD